MRFLGEKREKINATAKANEGARLRVGRPNGGGREADFSTAPLT
jgi:hypothetical protein